MLSQLRCYAERVFAHQGHGDVVFVHGLGWDQGECYADMSAVHLPSGEIRRLSLPQSADCLGSGPNFQGNQVSDSIHSLMFAIQAAGACFPCLSFKLFSVTATGQGRRHDRETTVDHALMRGLVAAGPVMRRGATSV
jgi:hypothetical protein